MALEAIQTAHDDTMAQDAESVSAGYSTDRVKGALQNGKKLRRQVSPAEGNKRCSFKYDADLKAHQEIQAGGTNKLQRI